MSTTPERRKGEEYASTFQKLTTPPANDSKALKPSRQMIATPSNLGTKALLRNPRHEASTIHAPRKMLYFVLAGAGP